MRNIKTIGYEGADIADFIATLSQAGVETLVDVRELPMSRRKGFSKTKLAALLEESGIQYVHVRGLGDPKDGRIAAREGRIRDFKRIFSAHTKTDPYKSGLEYVSSLSKSDEICLMCYERDYRECHRAIVADDLSGIVGLSVMHIGVREGIAKDATKAGARKGAHSRQSASACR